MIPILIGAAIGAGLVGAFISKRPFSLIGEEANATAEKRGKVLRYIMVNVHTVPQLNKAAATFHRKGYPREAKAIASKAKSVKHQAKIGAEWVERARAGDQNAIGAIVATRENARRGNLRAKVSCDIIRDYIRKHPVAGIQEVALVPPETPGSLHVLPIVPDSPLNDPLTSPGHQFDPGLPPPPEDPPTETPTALDEVEVVEGYSTE